MTTGGMLVTVCTCESAFVLATPAQVRDGVAMTCGHVRCAGEPADRLGGRRPTAAHPAPCGTEAGVARHRRAHEKPCRACLRAAALAADHRRNR